MRRICFARNLASVLVVFLLSPAALPGAETATQNPLLKEGVKLFSDRPYELTEAPDILMGQPFVRTSIEGCELECVKPGDLYVMTITGEKSVNQTTALQKGGFERVGPPEFQLFPGEVNRVSTWKRKLNPGDHVAFKKLAFPVLGDGLEVKLLKEAGQKVETPEETAVRIRELEKVAEHALVPPVLNTSPLPEYDYENLDYGMTIGIERSPGGRLWACWVAGGDSPEAYFVIATSDDDGQTWSKPRLVLDSHDDSLPRPRSILVGNLWTDPLGRLWLFFDQSMEMFDGRGGVWATVCENPDADNPQWSDPERIWHGVMLNKPTVLSSGEWVLPISLDQRGGLHSFKGCFAELDPLRGANVFVSTDEGKSWERRGKATFPSPDWHEHMIVERKDESLWMLARTSKGIMESSSTDGGKTWSEAAFPEGIGQPNARFFVRRLASGNVLLVKHGDKIESHEGRFQLSAWLSSDEGKTWKGGLVLDERKGISYPDGFQAPDGTLYVSYDRNRSKDGEILMARFTEDDILAKDLTGPKSKLKMLISRPLAQLTKPESAFTPIFDGKTFDGWEQKGNWVIEEGAFYRSKGGGPLTYTAAKVPDDFELRFDWKVSEGCNSGVYYRSGQVEYQVLDNVGSPYGENARQAAASLFFCMAPSKDATRPVGEWNTARILCKGSVIEHWMNGERVLSFDYDDPKWKWYVDLLDARGGNLRGRNGEIWLQDHGQDVWFRNLRWRTIPADEDITPELYFEPMSVTGEALKKEEARVEKMLKAKAEKAK
ncbi:family 16 glycoside hydrolase [Verrucomicrobiales bacterium BCK34]|nr:family 16 glycoside hydrolase [Verrucomicrobiales bacterium BCK34]